MSNTLRLTPKAKDALQQIGLYTHQNFGERQMEIYLTKIDDGFKLICSEPTMGVARDEIKKGYRSFVVGKHSIFYRISGNKVEVIGITSAKMDVKSHYLKTMRIT